MRLLFSALFLLSCLVQAQAQNLTGKVFGKGKEEKELLVGASVVWIHTTVGATTNENGVFKISTEGITDKRLLVSYVGYQPDTLLVAGQTYLTVLLTPNSSGLQQVTVIGQKPTGFISWEMPYKTEIITAKELTKAACCDLAGCFETQATVQPQTTNVLTNSRELRILGLSGVYNQVLFDGFPLVQGLSYTYGISSIPGTLVGNIYVSKGTNSVLQGFESISGQINVEPKEADRTDRLLLNGYINNFREKHLNANYSFRVGKHKAWSSLLAFHMVQPAGKFDRDDDTFLDLPRLTRYMLYNQWKYGSSDSLGWSTKIGVRLLRESRIGGQTNFNPATDKGSDQVYGQAVKMYQPELYTKTSYRFGGSSALSFLASAFHQQQNSYFGTVKYDARQTNFYSNLQYEKRWHGQHELKAGLSLRSVDLNENIGFTEPTVLRTYAGTYLKQEFIPGIFAENVFYWQEDKLIWIVGARVDHHNRFGAYLTPRTLLRYNLTPKDAVGASIGSGWRTVNLLSENINLLASSRDILFAEPLQPERAVNAGINYTRTIEAENVTGTVGVDYYQTRFQNQFFPDYDTNPTQAIIRNYTGKSQSNSLQVESNLKFYNLLEARLAYSYLEVYRADGESRYELPFNPKHRWMAALSYRPEKNNWYFDVNAHWFGEQRLPSTESNPAAFRRPLTSKPYSLVNAQVTKLWPKFEVYLGVENIFDFRQQRPINSWQDPFGPYFDTSLVWGPTRGREAYVGVRFIIK